MLPSELVVGKTYYCYLSLGKKKKYSLTLSYSGIDERIDSNKPILYVFESNYMDMDEVKFTESELLDLRVNE